MPWHLSKSDPRKVYDERHTEICIACTGEAAALIVMAVNFLRGQGVIAGTSGKQTVKPDMAKLQAESLGVSQADVSFAVTRRR